MSLAEKSDFGIVRLIVDDVTGTASTLRDAGFVASMTDVMAVEVPNVPGGLNRVLEILDGAGINVEYMYAILGNKKSDTAYMIFRVNDNAKASSALRSSGVKIMEAEELSAL